MSLLAIIKEAVVSTESQASLLYRQNLVWLLDTLQPLHSILVSWPTPLGVGLAPVLQVAVDLAEAHTSARGPESVLHHKASAALALVCSDFVQHPKLLLAEDEDGASLRRVFCFSLLQLAKAAADYAPTSRLIASGLTFFAQRLVSENPIVGIDTDVWVSLASSRIWVCLLIMIQRAVDLLRQATASPLTEGHSQMTQSTPFADAELRQQAQKLVFRPRSDQSQDLVAKRRKIDDSEPSSLLELAAQVCRLVDADLNSQMDELESHIMFVHPLLARDFVLTVPQ